MVRYTTSGHTTYLVHTKDKCIDLYQKLYLFNKFKVPLFRIFIDDIKTIYSIYTLSEASTENHAFIALIIYLVAVPPNPSIFPTRIIYIWR
jgi:hypothetical protein